jgi:hypothetical protein
LSVNAEIASFLAMTHGINGIMDLKE